jgi:hypothetical protein
MSLAAEVSPKPYPMLKPKGTPSAGRHAADLLVVVEGQRILSERCGYHHGIQLFSMKAMFTRLFWKWASPSADEDGMLSLPMGNGVITDVVISLCVVARITVPSQSSASVHGFPPLALPPTHCSCFASGSASLPMKWSASA